MANIVFPDPRPTTTKLELPFFNPFSIKGSNVFIPVGTLAMILVTFFVFVAFFIVCCSLIHLFLLMRMAVLYHGLQFRLFQLLMEIYLMNDLDLSFLQYELLSKMKSLFLFLLKL